MANPIAVLASHGIRVTKDGVHFSKPIYFRGRRVIPPEGVSEEDIKAWIEEGKAEKADSEIQATRAAKALAKRENLDLSEVKGTGTGGEILVKDVQEHFEISKISGLEASASKELEEPKATEAAQNLAAEHEVDLELLTGTGKNNQIVLKDVQDYLDSLEPEEDDEEE